MSSLVILAGGKGGRFAPAATKYYPKEMLPLGRLPAIHQVLEESLHPAFDRIVLLYRYHGDMLKHYISEECHNIAKLIEFVEQGDSDLYGTGAAVLSLHERLRGEKKFAVSFPDDVILGGNVFDLIMPLANAAEGVVASAKVDYCEAGQFGNLSVSEDRIMKIVQKPKPDEGLSNIALVSKLLLPEEIFEYLSSSFHGQEMDLGVAVAKMIDAGAIYKTADVTGRWVTTGDPISYAKGLELWRTKYSKTL
ncbi:UTP--glucose-1-phosphate uridylyltransferase [Alphaproteobacteria bacterium]|nr:UTP--glucose-1-phosphate uridylyltransferase [Alphaproteobacteria bacterium]